MPQHSSRDVIETMTAHMEDHDSTHGGDTVKVAVTVNDNSLDKLTVSRLTQLLSERGGEVEGRKRKAELLTSLKCIILKEELIKVRGIISPVRNILIKSKS